MVWAGSKARKRTRLFYCVVRWPWPDERSPLSSVAGVAPACALAGAFAKARAQSQAVVRL